MSKAFAVFVAILLLPPVAWAQTQAGGEFRLNTYTLADQFLPAASADRRGNFVITWGSGPGQDGNLSGAFGQRFDPSGLSLGDEFRVNSYTTGSQVLFDMVNGVIVPPSVGHDARGNFVVVWTSSPGQDGGNAGIFAQRYDASGARRGTEFRINSYTTGTQIDAEVAVAPAGSFVVVWTAISQPGDVFAGIFGQRHDASGQRVGGEFHVNTFVAGDQEDPNVAIAPDGRFVVVWTNTDGSNSGVFGQRFDSAGARAGAEFRVNTYTPGDQLHPTVATDAAGNFVVVWHGATPADTSGGIVAQRHDAAGNRLGGEFQVNAYATSAQSYASVARDEAGNMVVAWFGNGPGDPSFGTFGRRFNSAGVARGAEFMANTSTIAYQGLGEVTSDEVGNFLVTWTSFTPQDGSGLGAYAQRFGGVRPAALTVLNAGNQVWEPGEAVVLQPTWQNVNGAGATLTFNGVLSNLTGPAASYVLTGANATYGSVLDGATQSCLACYGVSVNNPSPRPALHWDATADERITPDTLGQTKRWALHLGRSFADVPQSNGFYPFIETLLHHSVTGGCTGTTYCPATSTTREQMAVFVLAAKEGAGYVPTACTTPVFNDVPASSPFCRFIEELARRGVVSGCGGGNYCPSNPVTREQMSIFVLLTLDPTLDPPACTTPMFADVPATSAFCRWIEELARRGVVTGCGGGNYCPAAAVTREQMGVFIAASFGLSLYGP